MSPFIPCIPLSAREPTGPRLIMTRTIPGIRETMVPPVDTGVTILRAEPIAMPSGSRSPGTNRIHRPARKRPYIAQLLLTRRGDLPREAQRDGAAVSDAPDRPASHVVAATRLTDRVQESARDGTFDHARNTRFEPYDKDIARTDRGPQSPRSQSDQAKLQDERHGNSHTAMTHMGN
jgi:hypothetical protein